MTLLCLASYEKGHAFLRQAKRNGARVLLVTSRSLEETARWPEESIDEIFYVPDDDKVWNVEDLIGGVNFLARSETIDRIVALDDFDVEKGARLREHLRTRGMGETTARRFRDKLAMRTEAVKAGIRVPKFVHTLNHDQIKEFLDSTPAPYVLKPRQWAGAIGIRKMKSGDEVWEVLEAIGDNQSSFVLEQFLSGQVYHIDSLVSNDQVLLSVPHRYGTPPMEVAHEGRVFSSITLPHGSHEESEMKHLNEKVLLSFELKEGVSHTEFLRADFDNEFYFLETSSRVGGANIVELVEAGTGLNMWAEWANIETTPPGKTYTLPPHANDYAGLIISLAKQEWPDLVQFDDKEIFWRLRKRHHAGLIFRSPDYGRIEKLILDYTQTFYDQFFAMQPPRDRPSD